MGCCVRLQMRGCCSRCLGYGIFPVGVQASRACITDSVCAGVVLCKAGTTQSGRHYRRCRRQAGNQLYHQLPSSRVEVCLAFLTLPPPLFTAELVCCGQTQQQSGVHCLRELVPHQLRAAAHLCQCVLCPKLSVVVSHLWRLERSAL